MTDTQVYVKEELQIIISRKITMYIPRHNLKKEAKQMNEMTKKVTNVKDKVQYTVNVNESLGLEYMHIKY